MTPPELSIQVNGDSRRVPDPTSVADLISTLGLGRRRVAVAVNRDVVPRSHFPEHRLNDGDRVEILEAVGGG
jgi:thiamine biosynthesis protein ThiS